MVSKVYLLLVLVAVCLVSTTIHYCAIQSASHFLHAFQQSVIETEHQKVRFLLKGILIFSLLFWCEVTILQIVK